MRPAVQKTRSIGTGIEPARKRKHGNGLTGKPRRGHTFYDVRLIQPETDIRHVGNGCRQQLGFRKRAPVESCATRQCQSEQHEKENPLEQALANHGSHSLIMHCRS